MPRPIKCRRVCCMPATTHLCPKGCAVEDKGSPIQLAVEEYEAIRLIDFLGMTQEECAAQMRIARTTAQAIYASARKKLAQCLVQGRELTVTGGEYRLCQPADPPCSGCGRSDCPHKQAILKEGAKNE